MQGKKIVIAAGGTGGHLFPAQALALELLENKDQIEVLFAGTGLSSNRYFSKEQFRFQDILSSTPFRGKWSKSLKSAWTIAKGVKQGLRVLQEFKPDVVVGFGSFHSFPVLLAAVYKKIPIVLFESNSEPGHVNRFFSRWAKFSAVQFAKASDSLFGKTIEVAMPLWQSQKKDFYNRKELGAYFSLDPHLMTFLIFGGSQGAVSINHLFCEAALLLKKQGYDFQVIHLAGNEKGVSQVSSFYAEQGIRAFVKSFEPEMSKAWAFSSLAICRAGAATLAELLSYEVPGILIPYPHAMKDHQQKNAQFFERVIGGAVTLPENGLSASLLCSTIHDLLGPQEDRLKKMQEALALFKTKEQKQTLSTLVLELVHAARKD